MDLHRPHSEDLNAGSYAAAESMRELVATVLRRATRQPALLGASLLAGAGSGLIWRAWFDSPAERDLGNFFRSGVHGAGIGLTIFIVLTAFDAGRRSRLGAALRQLPLAAEVLVRTVIMTTALVIVGLGLQAMLYWQRYHLHWLNREWLAFNLPSIVLVGFGFSLVIGIVVEARRLIGDELLASVALGTYHRPTRKQLIVMFLDLANSTRLAESLGEVRVQDLITRFFNDIDEPIADCGGAVHAYVGDEAIVAWPATDDPAKNARPIACFFAIERKMAALAPAYERAFGVAPSSAPASTPARSSSANAATPSASSPISATR